MTAVLLRDAPARIHYAPRLRRPEAAEGRPRVVIVGAGFGGLSAARALARAPVDVTLIDKRNYHLFQPLLYQVATAGLSPADIASPIRGILAGQANARVLMGKVTGIDREGRQVLIGERRVPYDYLVIATGARHAYFGKDEWEPFAPGLKKIEDATDIRRRILLAFEQAETEPDPVERQRLLSFVIVGGGPTGVELAGAIAELSKVALARDFRSIDPRSARVILVQSGERLLPVFPPRLSEAARKSLERLGVEVRLGHPVSECGESAVRVGPDVIDTRTVIWAAGVAASPAAKWLQAEKDRADRVKVDANLNLPGDPRIFVIGDTALAVDSRGNPLPGLAPVAKQQGAYVAARIAARVTQDLDIGPFVYHHLGNLATVGRKAAVADFGFLRLQGSIAWLLWGVVHVLFLIGFRNRVAVLLDWIWAYLTFQRGSRLITGVKG
ncbi:MAG: NAD(P)/FAD-dependent oxidoreductase [Alphaproteobacteria bacterium]|nr:NAD(P)/FAD-dependent oxidoreductase [Alphaproteobacteria bacterium]